MTNSAKGPRMAQAPRRQQARRRFGNEPSLRNGVENDRVVGGDDVVAVQQHGGADADGEAADRGDQRLLVARQRVEKFRMRGSNSAGFGRFEKIGDIAAGAERAGTAGEA
jgi:hypothetical protein